MKSHSSPWDWATHTNPSLFFFFNWLMVFIKSDSFLFAIRFFGRQLIIPAVFFMSDRSGEERERCWWILIQWPAMMAHINSLGFNKHTVCACTWERVNEWERWHVDRSSLINCVCTTFMVRDIQVTTSAHHLSNSVEDAGWQSALWSIAQSPLTPDVQSRCLTLDQTGVINV